MTLTFPAVTRHMIGHFCNSTTGGHRDHLVRSLLDLFGGSHLLGNRTLMTRHLASSASPPSRPGERMVLPD